MSRPASTNALENRVLDLWEAGLSKERIADQLEVTLGTVDRVFGYMHDRHEQRRANRAIAAGSQQLARAITQARGLA